MLNIYCPDPPPPLPPITTITTTTTTAAIATALNPPASHFPPRVSFQDITVEPFNLKFYIKLGLLKTIHSHLKDEIPFKLILLVTLYLCKDSLECKVKSLLKSIKNTNNIIVKWLSEEVIKSNNEVRALISILQKYAILSLENINEINKYCFKPKLYQEL